MIILKKTIKKVIVAVALLALGQAVPVLANECDGENFVTVVEVDTMNGMRSSDAWGKGSIKASDPLGAKPQAYARTEVYSGNANVVKAQIFCDDDNGDTYCSEVKIEYNVSTVDSATVSSKTSSCTFRGDHWIQLVSGGGWQSAQTSKTY